MLLTTVVGFGLPDLRVDEDNLLNDERVDETGFLHCPFDYSYDDYYHSVPRHISANFGHEHLLSDFIFCHNKVVCIIPPENPSLAQLAYCDEPPNEEVELLTAVPGFSNLVDRQTGAPVPHSLFYLFQQEHAKLSNPVLCSVERMQIEYALLDLAEMMGFRTMDDVLPGVGPVVPESVSLLCEYAKLFKRKDTALTLRPMRYSFWR